MQSSAKKSLRKLVAKMKDKDQKHTNMVDAIQSHYPHNSQFWCGVSEDDLRMTGMAQGFVTKMVDAVTEDHQKGIVSLGKRLSCVEDFIEGYRMALPSDSDLYNVNGRDKVMNIAFGVGEAAGLPTEMIDCAWEAHAP